MEATLQAPQTPREAPKERQGNPALEQLWKNVFKDEYRPEQTANFSKIKNHITTRLQENHYRKMRDYNYKIMNPEVVCDYFIDNNIQNLSISNLESIPEDMKRCLADMLLELISLESIKRDFGISLLFWIRNHGYEYGNNREKIRELLIQDESFVGSRDNYDLLEKAAKYQWRLYRQSPDIKTVLLQYQIFTNLNDDIQSPDIKKQLKSSLGSAFSLGTFNSRDQNPKGKEKDRYRKQLDKNGNDLSREEIDSFSKYVRDEKKQQSYEIPNRSNPEAYSDLSGRCYKIFLDGPIAIGLYHKNNPVALISFSLKSSDTMFVHQMQAIMAEYVDRYGRTIAQKVDPILQHIPWQKTLYDIMLTVAKKYGCKKIIIQSGENNDWTTTLRQELSYDDHQKKRVEITLDQPHLSLDIAQKIYDTFAEKEGYTRDEKTKNWEKKITS